MWICKCGQETSRGRTNFSPEGKVVGECCPGCNPEAFEGPIRVPSDLKIYSGPQAMPNMYRRGDDGTYHAKDELISDTVAGWDRGPTERACDWKRKHRRTEPLTPEEIRRSQEWGERVLAPALRAEGAANLVGALHGGIPDE